MEGRIEKYYKEHCLQEQPIIKLTDKTVQDLLNVKIMKLGENITVRRFVRYEVGEGLAKKEQNYVDEVMSLIK